MKKLLAVLLMVLLLPCTGHAIQVTVNSAGTGANATWTGYGSGNGFAGVIITSIGPVYCVELEQSVGPGIYEYDVITPTGVYIKAAWLLNRFGAEADAGDEAAGLQAAIWEAIYGNNFDLTGTAAVLEFQKTYLAALPENPSLPEGYVILTNRGAQDLITRVPEPMTMLLLGLGFVGLAGLRRKQ